MRCGLESPLQWLRQISDFHCVVRCSAFVPHITYFSGYSSPTRQPCITHSLTHSQPRQPTVCQNACTEVRAHAKHNISSCRKSAKGKHDWKKKMFSKCLLCTIASTSDIGVGSFLSPPRISYGSDSAKGWWQRHNTGGVPYWCQRPKWTNPTHP